MPDIRDPLDFGFTRPDAVHYHGDRGILIGANGTGKSTLAAAILRNARAVHPHARILIADTKPRWRAERFATGSQSARWRYRKLGPGDTLPGAMAISTPAEWGIAWDDQSNPSRTVILQRVDSDNDAANVSFQVACIQRFFQSLRATRPSILYIDEGMDFFHVNAHARGGSDIVQRCFRAGRERGLATLIGVQRPKGINLQCLTETNYCALFRINYRNDVKYLYDMGWPQDVGAPSYAQAHAFRLWRGDRPGAPLYRLQVDKPTTRKEAV